MSQSDFSGEYEYTIDTVTGVRGFRQDGLGRLTGVTHHRVFAPGVNVAACESCDTEHLATCTCGYYAYFSDKVDDRNLRSEVYDSEIGAIIEGTGRIAVGTRGFRAEKARLVALFPTDASARGNGKKGPINWFTRYLYPSYAAHMRLNAQSKDAGPAIGIPSGFLGLAVFATAVAVLVYGDVLLSLALVVSSLYLFGLLFRMVDADMEKEALRRRARPGRTGTVAETGLFDELKELYPNVPVYKSPKDARKAHPLTNPADYEPVKPTPKNTDDFWSLPDPENRSYISKNRTRQVEPQPNSWYLEREM